VSRDCLFIFDCDGVLVDSEAIASEVFSSALAELGVNLSPADADREFRGRSLADCIRLVEQRWGRAVPPEFLFKLEEATMDAFAREPLLPVAHIEQVLALLAALGVPRCVASSGSLGKVQRTLRMTGLLDYFVGSGTAHLFSAEHVQRAKPAPDLFLWAAEQMGFPSSRCFVIEDSVAGVAAGRSAGMSVFGYVPKHAPAEQAVAFEGLGARVVSSMLELKTLISSQLEDRPPAWHSAE
jgi:HAD superfamily hydrolase (TIGR01509 family)